MHSSFPRSLGEAEFVARSMEGLSSTRTSTRSLRLRASWSRHLGTAGGVRDGARRPPTRRRSRFTAPSGVSFHRTRSIDPLHLWEARAPGGHRPAGRPRCSAAATPASISVGPSSSARRPWFTPGRGDTYVCAPTRRRRSHRAIIAGRSRITRVLPYWSPLALHISGDFRRKRSLTGHTCLHPSFCHRSPFSHVFSLPIKIG